MPAIRSNDDQHSPSPGPYFRPPSQTPLIHPEGSTGTPGDSRIAEAKIRLNLALHEVLEATEEKVKVLEETCNSLQLDVEFEKKCARMERENTSNSTEKLLATLKKELDEMREDRERATDRERDLRGECDSMVEHFQEALDRGEKMKKELALAKCLLETTISTVELERSRAEIEIQNELLDGLIASLLCSHCTNIVRFPYAMECGCIFCGNCLPGNIRDGGHLVRPVICPKAGCGKALLIGPVKDGRTEELAAIVANAKGLERGESRM